MTAPFDRRHHRNRALTRRGHPHMADATLPRQNVRVTALAEIVEVLELDHEVVKAAPARADMAREWWRSLTWKNGARRARTRGPRRDGP